MSWFNTNTFHNVINVAIVLIGALAGFDFSVLGMDPETALKVTGGLALAKLVINAFRDGPSGMASPQPPVEK